MGTSRSRSAGALSDCVTRFRGGALRHAKFPKTSYKVQLLDTLKHAACVSLNRGRRRGLIFLSSKVLVHFWQNASVLSGEGIPRAPDVTVPPKGKPRKGEALLRHRRILILSLPGYLAGRGKTGPTILKTGGKHGENMGKKKIFSKTYCNFTSGIV